MSRLALTLLASLWLGSVAGGFAVLAREQYTPVAATPALSQFPRNALLTLAVNQPTLVVFLHPHCPCSRATLGELARIVGTTGDRLGVDIVFTIPENTPPDWELGDLWTASHAMNGVRVVRDPGGVVTRQFHVIGSGHTLLYDGAGQLLFSGGITASRGEAGDNTGEAAIIDFVLHGHAKVRQTPVFGCSLL